MLRSLARRLNQPVLIRRVNGWAVWVWLLLCYPTIVWWKQSILWVAVCSIWANVVSHYTAWLTARVEVREEHIESHTDADHSGPR